MPAPATKDMTNSEIPWFRLELSGLEETLVREVLASTYLNDGDVTRRFESEIAKIVGCKYAVGVTSGTAAIALALMAHGVGKGDEVIVPDLTFIATANAVRLTGADVKLVDVDPVRLTIDVDAVEAAIGARTRAVLPVDVNGRGCDYERLETLCARRNLLLVCDAAEALGSRYKAKALGGLGHAGCLSFSANKTVTTGQGGAVTTNDEKIYHRLLELKDQGRRRQGSGGDDNHPVHGFNFKLTNLQAAVGLAQLKKFDERIANSRRRDALYRELLSDCRDIVIPPVFDGEALQWTDALSPRRHEIESALTSMSAGFRRFWLPLHTQAPYRCTDIRFANASAASACGLWLPSYFSLTPKEIERVSDAIMRALS